MFLCSDEKAGYLAACLDYDDYGVHYPVAVTADHAAIEKFGVRCDQTIMFKREVAS